MTENERFTENGKTINGWKMAKSFEKCLNDNKKHWEMTLKLLRQQWQSKWQSIKWMQSV